MLTTKIRNETFGNITYSPTEDKFYLESKLERVELLEQKLSAPLTLHWLLTMKCNARCPYCYLLPDLLKPSDEEEALSRENIEKVLEDFERSSVFRIYITGGEPTLNPNLEFILRTAYSKGIKTVVNSNGIHIPKNVYRALVETESRLSLSLDSYVRERHDQKRKQRSYDSIVDILRKAKKDRLDVRVVSVIQDEDYLKFGRFLSELGVNCWFLQEEVDSGNKDNSGLEKELKEGYPEIRIRVLPAIFDSVLYLLPNGDVGINLGDKRQVYGNLVDTSIQNIWKEHKYCKVKDHLGILNLH